MNLAILLFLVFSCVPDDGKELIAAFQALPEGASARKIDLLERLAVVDSEVVDRFIFRVMDNPGEAQVRAKAFFIWAERRFPQVITEYLESKKTSSSFRIFLSVLPTLTGFDSFTYLQSLCDDDTLTRYRKEVTVAIAALDHEAAFAYLSQKWETCGGFEEAFDLLPSLLSMKGARDRAFLEHLLKSPYPFARYEGAVRLLRPGPAFSLERIAAHLKSEENDLVRTKVLSLVAGLGMSDAALLILEASASHPEYAVHEIVDILSGMPIPVLRDALPADWFVSRWPLRFQVAALALTSSKEFTASVAKEEMELLKKTMRDRDPGVRVITATAIDRILSKKFSVEYQLKALVGGGTTDTQWEVLNTIQRFRLVDEAIVDTLLKLLHAQKIEIRIKAAEVLSVLGRSEAVPRFEKWLVHTQIPLRIAGIKALGRLGGAESVSILLDRLPRERGRALWEIVRSLKKVTGRNFGQESELWNRWWERNEGILATPQARKSLWYPEKKAVGNYATFYGLPVDSHNVAYVLDVSGSMQGNKISRMREELAAALKSYTGEHFINMIFFHNNIEKWKKRLTPMGDSRYSRRAEALLRIKYLRAGGGTNLYGAMMEALKDMEVDSVILLSDGDPTVGEIVDKEEILKAVIKKNRINQVLIHTVAIGSSDRSFMRRLAQSSGGTFKSVY